MRGARRKPLQIEMDATMPQLLSPHTVMMAKELWAWRFVNNLTGGLQTTSCTLLGVESVSWGCGKCSHFWKKSDGSKRDQDLWRSNLRAARQSSGPITRRERTWTNGRILKQS